ncbi:MAG: transporter, family, oxalate/formate antiporter [Acetobacteraceae bacterium]|jgi:OFA family oxalate/formate antiporter-like MFS transporter|nr:oxlT1 [Rhodopila sp.]MEA2729706.1 transporter, family, oxalate/formate antiporter [Acetobacteraceae bacterium]
MFINAIARSPGPVNRRHQLIFGVLCMMLIANLQYSWTLFVRPIQQAHGWEIAEIQWAFSIFIALETWFTPGAGCIIDYLGPRRGPKLAVALGGVMVSVAWVINAYADSLWLLYLGAALSGIGAGSVYATCVGGAVKWFPDRRGLASGLTAAGFGAGAAVTVIPIKIMIDAHGYSATFFWFGLLQGGLLFLIAWLLQSPGPGEAPAVVPSKAVPQSAHNYTPRAMLATPTFWLLYVMFVMASASGLMATAQLAVIAVDYKLSQTVLLFGASTLSVALVVDNIMNGAARPFFGWVSDQIGREFTMAVAFGLGGISYLLLGSMGLNPWCFVLFAALIFFTWGEIFSLFPSTCADTFGSKYATVNTSLLYTAKGVSALLVPFANEITEATGSWFEVFVAAAAANFIVVILAIFVLRPLRVTQHAKPSPEEAVSAPHQAQSQRMRHAD